MKLLTPSLLVFSIVVFAACASQSEAKREVERLAPHSEPADRTGENSESEELLASEEETIDIEPSQVPPYNKESISTSDGLAFYVPAVRHRPITPDEKHRIKRAREAHQHRAEAAVSIVPYSSSDGDAAFLETRAPFKEPLLLEDYIVTLDTSGPVSVHYSGMSIHTLPDGRYRKRFGEHVQVWDHPPQAPLLQARFIDASFDEFGFTEFHAGSVKTVEPLKKTRDLPLDEIEDQEIGNPSWFFEEDELGLARVHFTLDGVPVFHGSFEFFGDETRERIADTRATGCILEEHCYVKRSAAQRYFPRYTTRTLTLRVAGGAELTTQVSHKKCWRDGAFHVKFSSEGLAAVALPLKKGPHEHQNFQINQLGQEQRERSVSRSWVSSRSPTIYLQPGNHTIWSHQTTSYDGLVMWNIDVRANERITLSKPEKVAFSCELSFEEDFANELKEEDFEINVQLADGDRLPFNYQGNFVRYDNEQRVHLLDAPLHTDTRYRLHWKVGKKSGSFTFTTALNPNHEGMWLVRLRVP